MSERRLAWLALAGVLLAALLPERMARQGPTLCPFRRATGLPCPACGLTRSWNAAARLSRTFSLAATLLIALQLGRGRQPKVPAGVGVGFGAAWLGVWLGRLRGGRGGG